MTFRYSRSLSRLVLSIFAAALAVGSFRFAWAGPPVPFVDGFTGDIGVYAVRVDSDAGTFTPLLEVSFNENQSFPLASTFKTFVIGELMTRVNSGEIGWKQKVEISEADWSLDDGRFPRRSPVKKLAKKMISRSDNTSTDVLFKLVGLGAPTQTLSTLGLTGARVVMPTREFWLALSGLVPSEFPYGTLPAAAAAFSASSRVEQVAMVDALRSGGAGFSVDAIDMALDDFYAMGTYNAATTYDILDDVDNIATPVEMIRWVHYLFFELGLEETWEKQFRKVMAKGDGKIDRRFINVPLRYWGGKGGSDLGMGSVVGYGETRAGNHILYAIMGSRMQNEDADLTIIEDLITWVFDTLDAA